MKKVLSLGTALLFAVAMVWVYAPLAWAEEGTMAKGTCPEIMASNTPDVNGLVGALVTNHQNEELGRVADVTFSSDGGINFLVVSSCLPGMSGRIVGIPYKAFDNYPQGRSEVTLNLTMDEFKNAPSYSQDSWPNGVGKDWAQKDYEYFATTEYFG
jgi:hypothetical protein